MRRRPVDRGVDALYENDLLNDFYPDAMPGTDRALLLLSQ